MTDYQGFKHGSATFPLSTLSTNSLLRDADPFTFYALEYFESVLNTHLGARLEQDAAVAGMTRITDAVAETLPYRPEEYLTQSHIKFPLLALYRTESKFDYAGARKRSIDQFELVYVLPPLTAGEHEALWPILKAVASVIDNRAEQGFDPSYTPSTPTGTAGERVWSATRAGAERVDVLSVNYKGGFSTGTDVFMPAVVITLAATQGYDILESELQAFNGTNVHLDHYDRATETTELDLVQFKSFDEPTVTVIAPSFGPKAGGTAVTITGTNFSTARLPTVTIGGVACTNIVVVSTTSITATTGAHTVYGASLLADVVVTNPDTLSGTLPAAFTYTNP